MAGDVFMVVVCWEVFLIVFFPPPLLSSPFFFSA